MLSSRICTYNAGSDYFLQVLQEGLAVRDVSKAFN